MKYETASLILLIQIMMQTPWDENIIENLRTNLSHKITASIFLES